MLIAQGGVDVALVGAADDLLLVALEHPEAFEIEPRERLHRHADALLMQSLLALRVFENLRQLWPVGLAIPDRGRGSVGFFLLWRLLGKWLREGNWVGHGH